MLLPCFAAPAFAAGSFPTIDQPAEDGRIPEDYSIAADVAIHPVALEQGMEEVQALIDALPSAEGVADMEGQRTAYGRTQAAYDAYMALPEEQRGLITGAGVFEELFAFFNA